MTVDPRVEALVRYLASEAFMSFREMNEYLESLGVRIEGNVALSGEHVRQPHIWEGTTLLFPASEDYVHIVESLFTAWPVSLMIGDMADFAGHEEPWYVTWTAPLMREGDDIGDFRRPLVNRDVRDVADRAKHSYAVCTRELATVQYRLAELAGTHQLDRDESMTLQRGLVRVWEALYSGTLYAVRDSATPEDTWDDADITYSDGRRVKVQDRVEPYEESDFTWQHNPSLLGEGAVREFPLGTIAYIAPIKPAVAGNAEEPRP